MLQLKNLAFFLLICAVNRAAALGAISPIKSVLLENNPLGAKCLDGSPPVFYHRPGRGWGKNSWVFHLMGGGWCLTQEDCVARSATNLGSSKFWPQSNQPGFQQYARGIFRGILSPSFTENPRFASWNAVFMVYCDGASFTGEVPQPVQVNSTTSLYYHGYNIFSAVISALQSQSHLNRSTDVLLTGCSAGGVAVSFLCDRMAALLPSTVSVKCLMDGGYFPPVPSPFIPNYNFWNVAAQYVTQLQSPHYSDGCTAAVTGINRWNCFFAQVNLYYLNHPVMVVNSDADPVGVSAAFGIPYGQNLSDCISYSKKNQPWQAPPPGCSSNLTAAIQIYIDETKSNITKLLAAKPGFGAFIYPKVAHCSVIGSDWGSFRANGVSLPRAIAAWYRH